MILGEDEVTKLITDKKLVLIPEPKPDQWDGMTVDCHLGEKFFVVRHEGDGGVGFVIDLRRYKTAEFSDEFWQKAELDDDGCYYLKPRGFVLAYTKEVFAIPPELGLCAFVQGKSGLARIGLAVHVTAPTVHPGFGCGPKGPQPIMLEFVNHSRNTIVLPPGQPICQFVFQRVEGNFAAKGKGGLAVAQPKAS